MLHWDMMDMKGCWYAVRREQTDRQTYSQTLFPPHPSVCPFACSLFTSRAVTVLSEPIKGCHAVCQPCTGLDRMTSNFWCYVSRTIWKQMSSLLVHWWIRISTDLFDKRKNGLRKSGFFPVGSLIIYNIFPNVATTSLKCLDTDNKWSQCND